jgi:hypothetical protein
MRVVVVTALCAALSTGPLSGCASALKPVYVVPDGIAISGDGVAYPNESAKNVVTFSSGLPMMGRELTLTCADGQTETVQVTNDGIDPIGLVSTVVLGVLSVSNVASAVRSEFVGDQIYFGALATLTGGVGILTFLTSWQPSRPVTVNHPGTVCKSAVAPEAAPPPTLPTTAPTTAAPTTAPAPLTPAAEVDDAETETPPTTTTDPPPATSDTAPRP